MAEKSMNQPVLILPESYNRLMGRDAQRTNIMAARVVAETVRTTLGPKGMDKMLVDSLGDVVITNDGVTILEEMEIEHPAAKMMVEVAKTQEQEVGDGTTTAVVIGGELLKQAEELLDQNIHPSVLAKGYRMASEQAIKILNKIAKKVDAGDKETLKKVVATAMTGKSAETAREKFAELLVEASTLVSEKDGEKFTIDIENVKVEKKTGGSIDDSELIHGIVVDKERVHSDMPKKVADAKVLLLDAAIEIKETEQDAQIRISSPEQLQAFLENEERMLTEMVGQVKASGANVVFCQKGVDDIAQHFLAKAKIYVARRVKKSDMEKLARATGAKVVTAIKDISKTDLGYAGLVQETKLGDEDMTVVSKCKNPKAVTLLVRGGTEHVIDEIERAIEDALGDLKAVIENSKIVAGGGAPEMEVAKELEEYAQTLTGREQLAVKAFAKSMEIIPRTLAENAGIEPIDILVELKAKHEKGDTWAGVNVFRGGVVDMMKESVIEPLKIKTQAIMSASEVAVMILRIDDLIAAGKLSDGPAMPPGAMGGMPPGAGMY
jgi:thermosome